MSQLAHNYRIVNGVLAGWLIFPALLVWISPPLEKLFPRLWRCPYRAMTGENCPFCGLTRDLRSLFAGEPARLNSESGWFVALVALLLLWRVGCHFAVARLSDVGIRSWIVLDAVVTAALGSLLLFRLIFCRI